MHNTPIYGWAYLDRNFDPLTYAAVSGEDGLLQIEATLSALDARVTAAEAAIVAAATTAAGKPQGEIARALRPSNSGASSGTTELPVLRLDSVPVVSGRAYTIRTRTIQVQSTANGDGFSLRLRYTTNGDTPTISSPELVIGTVQSVTLQGSGTQPLQHDYYPTSDETLSILLTLQRRSGSGALHTAGPCNILIEDRGLAVAETGVVL